MAGKIPKNNPIIVEKVKARIIGKIVILVLRMVNLSNIMDIKIANTAPAIPPVTLKTMLSVRN